jgi:hypothetical protein
MRGDRLGISLEDLSRRFLWKHVEEARLAIIHPLFYIKTLLKVTQHLL